MDSTLASLSSAQLRRAADLKERIESLQNELSGLLGSSASFVPSAQGGKKRFLSAAAIARIRAAQKARWAKHRAAQGGKSTAKASASARKMPAAARARLAAIARARWAKAKASGRKAL